jgi:hypothetical protein
MCGNPVLGEYMDDKKVSKFLCIDIIGGRNEMPCLESQFTMTRIVVKLFESGECSMKSIEMIGNARLVALILSRVI